MQTNTNKRRRQNIQNITEGHVGPSNIPQDLTNFVNAQLPASDLVRKVAESIRGGDLITRRDRAVGIIQKYMRWFSEIGKVIRNSRSGYAYLINNISD